MGDRYHRSLDTDEIDGTIPYPQPSRKPVAVGQKCQKHNGKMAAVDMVDGGATAGIMNGLQKKKNADYPVCEDVAVKERAKDLAKDIIQYVAFERTGRTQDKYHRTMRRTVDELSERHEILFKGMVNKLNISDKNFETTFQNVADEIFQDRQYNWGRIVAVYAFASRLAKYCVQNNMEHLVDKITVMVGDYVSNRLGSWVHKQGGWEAFTEYFPEQNNLENTIWKAGLLFTAFGLGALATMVAAR